MSSVKALIKSSFNCEGCHQARDPLRNKCGLCMRTLCPKCCGNLRVSYPASFGHSSPKFVCLSCRPSFFFYRNPPHHQSGDGTGRASEAKLDKEWKEDSSITLQRQATSKFEQMLCFSREIGEVSKADALQENEETSVGEQEQCSLFAEDEQDVSDGSNADGEETLESSLAPPANKKKKGWGKPRDELKASIKTRIWPGHEVDAFVTSPNVALSAEASAFIIGVNPTVNAITWFGGCRQGKEFSRKKVEMFMKPSPISQAWWYSKVRLRSEFNIPVPVDLPVYDPTKGVQFDVDSQLVKADASKTKDMLLRVYTPRNGVGPFPILIWYHGGGFCLGSINDPLYDGICRRLCNRAECVVVTPEYRLSPENKFPCQIEDCYAALEWVHENADLLHGDPTRIAVSGDSAGGTIALTVPMMAIDRKGPAICHQLLVFPCLVNPCTDDVPSQVKYKDGPMLTRPVLKWFVDSMFEKDELSSKIRTLFTNLTGYKNWDKLPPATIINAHKDPLRDHGAMIAELLRGNNVDVARTVYTTAIHGFFGTQVGESNEAVEEATYALRRAFGIDKL